MTLKMVDRKIRFSETDREALRNRCADHQGARQARPAGRREGVDLRHLDLGFARDMFEQSRGMDQMIA